MATTHRTTRRAFLGSTALAGATAAFGGTGASAQSHPKYGESDYQFEIMRTDEEWRGILTEYEHSILRLGGSLLPGVARGRLDWLYGEDVTRRHPMRVR